MTKSAQLEQRGGAPGWRALRRSKGLTLVQVATKADLDPGHLSRIERGQSKLSVESFHRLAKALGLRELTSMMEPFVEERSS